MSPDLNKYNFLNDYPVSSMCIADLVDKPFEPDRRSHSDLWINKVSTMIWLAYFGLLTRGLIKIESKIIKRTFLFGLFKQNVKCFIPYLSDKLSQTDKLGWIETQIISSINNSKSQCDKDILSLLRTQARLAVDELLGKYEEYKAPEKKIVELAILYDKHGLWDRDYKSRMGGLKRSMHLKIDHAIKNTLVNHLVEFQRLEFESSNSNHDLKILKKKIRSWMAGEIDRRRINYNDEYNG